MSHFTVLVIGDKVEEQLAPYDENIVVDEYEKEIVSDEEKNEILEYYTNNENFVGTFDECYALYGEEWDGNRLKKDENGVWKHYSCYNPKSKWDWYQVGGRWSGYFKLKNRNAKTDVVLKKDIDFDGMLEDGRKDAAEDYDKIMSIVSHLPEIENWESVRTRFDDIQKAREFYNSQERVKALQENKIYFVDLEDYKYSRDEYIKRNEASQFTPYAVVLNGEWYEKGQMGWFGMSSNDMDNSDWKSKVKELIDSVDDDTVFTLVDAHI